MNRVPRNLDASFDLPITRKPGCPVFAIGESVIEQSERWLKSPPWRGRESIVYWAGVKRADVWMVLTAIKPRATTTRGSFDTSAADNAQVIEFLAQSGLALLGQVHTHGGSYVDHSAGDDADAFMPKENSLSIVVPHYGRQGMRPLHRCGVHRYESGRFRRLATLEIDVDVCIVPISRNFST